MDCNLAVGKEPELMQEVERYQLDLVGLPSIHSMGSETGVLLFVSTDQTVIDST